MIQTTIILDANTIARVIAESYLVIIAPTISCAAVITAHMYMHFIVCVCLNFVCVCVRIHVNIMQYNDTIYTIYTKLNTYQQMQNVTKQFSVLQSFV